MKKYVTNICVLFVSLFVGCTTLEKAVSPLGTASITPGYYILDAPTWYKKGYAFVEYQNPLYRVTLLENRGGHFYLKPISEKEFMIVEDDINFYKIKRTLDGKGSLIAPNRMEGDSKTWLVNGLGFKRDHRVGRWTLYYTDQQKAQRETEEIKR